MQGPYKSLQLFKTSRDLSNLLVLDGELCYLLNVFGNCLDLDLLRRGHLLLALSLQTSSDVLAAPTIPHLGYFQSGMAECQP